MTRPSSAKLAGSCGESSEARLRRVLASSVFCRGQVKDRGLLVELAQVCFVSSPRFLVET